MNGRPQDQRVGGSPPAEVVDAVLPRGTTDAKAMLTTSKTIRDRVENVGEQARRTVGGTTEALTGELDDIHRDERPGLADRVSNAAGAARERVTDAAGAVRDTVFDAADVARNQASEGVRRARDTSAQTYDDVRSWAEKSYEAQRRRAAVLTRRGSLSLRRGRNAAEDFVSEYPLLVGMVGLATGLLIGALLPRTRQEDRVIGPYADEARAQGVRYARDMTEKGREFVASALDSDHLNEVAHRTNVD